MEKLKQLIKESFELWVKKRWLKELNRSLDSYNKSNAKARRDYYVLQVMLNEYNERYPDAQIKINLP